MDTDYDGWTLPNGTWDEARMHRLLASNGDVVRLQRQELPESAQPTAPYAESRRWS